MYTLFVADSVAGSHFDPATIRGFWHMDACDACQMGEASCCYIVDEEAEQTVYPS